MVFLVAAIQMIRVYRDDLGGTCLGSTVTALAFGIAGASVARACCGIQRGASTLFAIMGFLCGLFFLGMMFE